MSLKSYITAAPLFKIWRQKSTHITIDGEMIDLVSDEIIMTWSMTIQATNQVDWRR